METCGIEGGRGRLSTQSKNASLWIPSRPKRSLEEKGEMLRRLCGQNADLKTSKWCSFHYEGKPELPGHLFIFGIGDDDPQKKIYENELCVHPGYLENQVRNGDQADQLRGNRQFRRTTKKADDKVTDPPSTSKIIVVETPECAP